MNRRGFTLLEVMIAVTILAVSLMAIFNLQSNAVLASIRAQRIGVATLLARRKMAEALLEFQKGMNKGEFPEEKEESGTFEEQNFPDYDWKFSVRKVEIPVPPAKDETAEVMTQVFKLISEQVSQSTRELQLAVTYQSDEEAGEPEELIRLTTHLVSMKGGPPLQPLGGTASGSGAATAPVRAAPREATP